MRTLLGMVDSFFGVCDDECLSAYEDEDSSRSQKAKPAASSQEGTRGSPKWQDSSRRDLSVQTTEPLFGPERALPVGRPAGRGPKHLRASYYGDGSQDLLRDGREQGLP